MLNAMKIVLLYLIVINIVTFAVYVIDKRLSKTPRRRIPEATLLGLAAIGGSVGAWMAMYTVRHKTKHLQFVLGVPALLLLQLALAWWLLTH